MNLDRRDFLRSLAALPFAARGFGLSRPRKARSLILVWLDGGLSHLDSFDCKPEASPEIRGDLGSMRVGATVCSSPNICGGSRRASSAVRCCVR